ncbi:MAG: hypothetical protein PUB99_08010 [Oscillospiraceae bacterium]|nr:hypothetical protein [Oscillospiraceae bacterium]
MLQKLKSRKFWAAVVGAVTGIAMIFGLDEGTISAVAETVTTIAGTVMTFGSLLGYIVTEGANDKAAIKKQ